MKKELSRLASTSVESLSFFVLKICSFLSLLQLERDRLLAEVENLAACSDGQTQKLHDIHSQKLKTLEAQVIKLLSF